MLDPSPIRRFTDAKTKQPSQRSRAKLSKLLAYEIESAARCVREHIADGDRTRMGGLFPIHRAANFLDARGQFMTVIQKELLQLGGKHGLVSWS